MKTQHIIEISEFNIKIAIPGTFEIRTLFQGKYNAKIQAHSIAMSSPLIESS